MSDVGSVPATVGKFFSASKQFVAARTNHFGKMINIALENSTNLWKYGCKYTLILDWYKIQGT